MKCYAVIDTNVLVSALLSSHEDAATVQIVNKIFNGDVVPVYSVEILKEYSEVLRRKKFKFSEAMITQLIGVIKHCGELVIPAPSGIILPDMKDVPFYEVVLEKRSKDDTYLVTGNIKHFPNEPFVVTAKEFLEILNNAAVCPFDDIDSLVAEKE